MRALAATILVALVVSTSARAQDAAAAPSTAPSAVTWASCFESSAAAPDTRYEGTVLNGSFNGSGVSGGSVPSGSTTSASSADGPLTGVGGGGGGEAMLVIAVAAAVALPIILYALDGPADADVLRRHECPRLRFEVTAGAVNAPTSTQTWAPLIGVRSAYTQGWFGLEASLESTLDSRFYGAMDAHLLLRVPPRQHVEGALALGVRRVVFGGAERNGLSVALPHRYVLTRIAARPVAVEITPGVFVGDRGLDYRLEAGMSIPIGFTSVQFGGRVFSFDSHLRAGAYLGFGAGN